METTRTLCRIRHNLYFSLRADGPYNYEFATRVCLGRRTRECQKVKYLSQGDELNHVNRTRGHMHPHTRYPLALSPRTTFRDNSHRYRTSRFKREQISLEGRKQRAKFQKEAYSVVTGNLLSSPCRYKAARFLSRARLFHKFETDASSAKICREAIICRDSQSQLLQCKRKIPFVTECDVLSYQENPS